MNNYIAELINDYNNKCIDSDNNTIINSKCKQILKELNSYYKNHSIEYKKKIKLK